MCNIDPEKFVDGFLTCSLIFAFVGLVIFLIMLQGCTLSFQNIDTHGTSSDLVDEVESTTPTISTTLKTNP
jgi:hypothetical protein